MSPSPSTSAAKTDLAPLADVVIVHGAVNASLPSFSYQAILSSTNRRAEDVHVAVAVDVCCDEPMPHHRRPWRSCVR